MAVREKGKQVAGKAPPSSASSSGKRKNPRADGESSGSRPKKNRSGVLQFVDDAAADADFEGEEDDDDLEWDEVDDFEFELPDIGAKEVKNVTNGPGKSSPLPFFIKEEEMDDDKLEEAIKERYRGSGFVSFDEDVKECDKSELVAHTTKHLSVWKVKCMIGRERQAVFCLMQKFVDLQKIGKKLLIFSVFVLDHVKGFVYIEADKACNVFEACNGLCILYPSRVELVPRNEAPNLLSIQKKVCGISKGMRVRMKNGKYKGDLAEVVLVNDAKKMVTIKLVPRIDFQAIAKKFGGGTSLKTAAIPAPRLISSHELEDFRPHIEVRRDRETGEIFEVLDGLMLKDGFLYKKVSMCSLIHWGVQPSSAELTKFEDTSKDEIKNVSWLSSIYKARMKKKLSETSNHKDGDKSNPKDGDKSNQKDGNKQRHGFDIDDLVLFGKKGCGIIVDKENDTFKVLKGDVNAAEIVSINIREIKKICVDKVFTATDRYMKTISIDDVVKVSEGPLEGREGIARHMYKGILYIYDECQSENNGFFCAKSEICDLVKKSRDFRGGRSGSKAGPSFTQPPIRSSEQEDNSRSFSRDRQSNSRGTFSVGQTLRIRKGPLKGYLCRVIRIYRTDITVKLDSLGKLLTVDDKLLSCPNSKRDDVTAMQCDMFGSQEEQAIGGLLDEGRGLGMDTCELNAGMSSFGRDSWNAPSSSSFSFPRDNDNKDQNQGADPWGSKLSSWNGDQEQGAANSWGKASSPNAEQNSWNKMENGEKGADVNCKNDADDWNKASSKGEASAGGWQNDKPSQKTGQSWSMKGASDGWDGAVNTVVDSVSDASGWSKAKLATPDPSECQTFGEDGWNRGASKAAPTISITETGGLEKTKLPSSDAGGSWNTKGTGADWNKESSGKDKAESFGGQSGNRASPKSGGGDNRDSWDTKGKCLLRNNEDSWVQPAESQEKKPVAGNPWESSFNNSGQSKAWKTPSTDDNQAANLGASAPSLDSASQTSSWDKVLTAPSHIGWKKSEQEGATDRGSWKKATEGNQAAGWAASAMHSATSSVEAGSQSNNWDKSLPSPSGWEKSKETVTETVVGWKTTTDGNKATGWGSSAMHLATPSVEHESQTSNWGKVSTSPSSSGWPKSKQVDAAAKDGCKKDGFSSEGQIDGWNKEKSSDMDPASGWNKAGNAEGGKDVLTDSWDKPKSSEGQGFGQESQREWKVGGDWCKNHHDPNVGKPKDSDWGQGSGWSKENSNNENGKNWGQGNSWNQKRDFDGGRESNRGRGRGRYGRRGDRNEDNFVRGGGRGRFGAGGYSRDNSDTREFSRGRGRGQGRGRWQGQGQFESSDRRNGRESFDGGFSNKPSSWGGAEGSGWGKSRDEQSSVVMDEKVGWNSGNTYGGGNTADWGTGPKDAGGSKNDTNVDHASSWSKGVSAGKQIDQSKDTRNDNWNTTKTFDNKLASWNQTSNDASKGDTKLNIPNTASNQSTDWKKDEIKSTTSTPSSSEVTFANWVHGMPESDATTSDDKWTQEKSNPDGHGDTLSGKLNSNDWCQKSTPNRENEAADSQGGWTSKKVNTQENHPSSENENKWGNSSGGTANVSGNLWGSKGWGDSNSVNSDLSPSGWDVRKEPTSSQGNWTGVGKDSFGNQSSDWDNGGGQFKSESWIRGSDFGRGDGRERYNSFSCRGSSRGGRNSGGRNSYGWNSSDVSVKEGNDKGQTFNSRQEFKTGRSWSSGQGTFEGEKGSWNDGGNAEKGSLSSCKSEGENQSTGSAKQDSWCATTSVSVNKVESGTSSWDSPKGFGSSVASGWESASDKELVAANKEGSTQYTASSVAKQKNSLTETDHVGAWDKNNVPTEENTGRDIIKHGWEDENSNKPGSWNGKGSGWSSEPAAAEGSLPVQAEAPKCESGWNAATDSSSRDALWVGGGQSEASSQQNDTCDGGESEQFLGESS